MVDWIPVNPSISIFLIIVFSSTACAVINEPVPLTLFEVLNGTYTETGIGQLQARDAVPDIQLENRGYCTGGVDIVGWGNMIDLNGTKYIYGNPADLAFISSSVKNTAPHPLGTSKSISFVESENGTLGTAVMDVRVKYEKKTKYNDHNSDGTVTEKTKWVDREKEYSFYDSEPIPEQFKPGFSKENLTAKIYIYNTSINEHTIILVPEPEKLLKVGYFYNGSEIYRFSLMGVAVQDEKKVWYTEMIPVNFWERRSSAEVQGIFYLHRNCMIPKAIERKNIDEELSIIMYDVYGNEFPIERYEVQYSEFDILEAISKLAASFVGFLLIMKSGIKKQWRILIEGF